MDGENHGKPYEQMDDLGGFYPYFLETPMSDHVRIPDLKNASCHPGDEIFASWVGGRSKVYRQ